MRRIAAVLLLLLSAYVVNDQFAEVRRPPTVRSPPPRPPRPEPLVIPELWRKQIEDIKKSESPEERALGQALQLDGHHYPTLDRYYEYRAFASELPPIFLVYRAEPLGDSPSNRPLYYLFHREKVGIFHGNQALGDLASEIARRSSEQGGGKGEPMLILLGQGTPQDFDAAHLTIEITQGRWPRDAEPNIGSTFRILGPALVQEFFRRDHVHEPASWGDKALKLSMRQTSSAALIMELEYGGHKATLIARTREVLAVLVASIRAFLAELGVFDRQLSDEQIFRLKARLEADLARLYASDGSFRQREGEGPTVTFSERHSFRFSTWHRGRLTFSLFKPAMP